LATILLVMLFISGEADDHIDDIQESLSSGNSCEEFQKDDVLVLCEDDIPTEWKGPQSIQHSTVKEMACMPWCSSFW